MTDLSDRLSALSGPQRELLELLLAEQRLDGESGERGRDGPLTSTQERLWAMADLVTDARFGTVPVVLRIRGALETDVLDAALRDVVRRHEILRSRVRSIAGEARQESTREIPDPAIVWEDSEPVGDAVRFGAALDRVRAIAAEPMDPSRRLWRAVGVRVEATDHLLLLLLHHLAVDGYGIRLLLQELGAHYRARQDDSRPQVPELRVQVLDLAEMEARKAGGPELQAHVEYWRETLHGARSLALESTVAGPAAPDGEATSSFEAERVEIGLPVDVAHAVRTLARAERVTPFMSLVAGFQAALQVHFGLPDLCIGTIISHRPTLDAERLIGNFGNNVFLRASIERTPTFRGLLRGARDEVLGAYAHSAFPLERLVQAGRISLPRFDVMIVLRSSPLAESLELPGLTVESVSLGPTVMPMDLQLDLTDHGTALSGTLEYRPAVLSGEEARTLAARFLDVLRRGTENPDAGFEVSESHPGRARPGRVRTPPATDRSVGPELTPSEARLAEMWRDALGIDRCEAVDNFFELGGHSLLALALLERIERETSARLSLVDLAMCTLAQLGARVDAATREDR